MEKSILKKLQLNELEILDEIVRVCEKYNINYYLIGGTLLGAIRHKGFIPWDDDIDIVMPRHEYYKFREVCLKELKTKYFLQDNTTEKEHFLPFAKVRKNDTIFEEALMINTNLHKGIFVDIFILDNATSPDSKLLKVQYLLFRLLNSMMIKKINKKKRNMKEKIISILAKPFSLKQLTNIQQKIMAFNTENESLYYVNMGSQYGIKKQTMPKDRYYPPVKVEFEGQYYNAPNDYDYILKSIYGNYMEIPKKTDRITHNPVRVKFENENEIIF